MWVQWAHVPQTTSDLPQPSDSASTSPVTSTPSLPTPTPRRFPSRLIVIVAAVATFWPVLGHDFQTIDDSFYVARPVSESPPSLDRIPSYWFEPSPPMYMPVTYTAWSLVAAVAQVDTPDAHGVQLDPAI